jgi:hypothetical protein
VEETYSKQIGDLFSQWAGRTPRTDVVLPPSDESGTGATDDASDRRAPASSTSRKAPLPAPAMAPATAAAEILIPAGRGRLCASDPLRELRLGVAWASANGDGFVLPSGSIHGSPSC